MKQPRRLRELDDLVVPKHSLVQDRDAELLHAPKVCGQNAGRFGLANEAEGGDDFEWIVEIADAAGYTTAANSAKC